MTPRLMMRTLAIALLAVGLGACSGSPKKKPLTLQDMLAADPLPLAKGSKWTYTVTVKRYDIATNKTEEKKIPWTTEVIDAREANGVTAYRIKGWPDDLMEYDGSGALPAPTETTILRRGNSFLFGSVDHAGEPTVDGATGWFQWPMVDGEKRCSAGTTYCWQATAIETGYRLSSYAGTDEQSFDLEPNTGVARFHYANHKTTNEVEAKLVSYTKGAR